MSAGSQSANRWKQRDAKLRDYGVNSRACARDFHAMFAGLHSKLSETAGRKAWGLMCPSLREGATPARPPDTLHPKFCKERMETHMKNMGKRVLSMALSLAMLLTLLPAPALAAETDPRGEQLDTAEVYEWLVENYAEADEDGAVYFPAGALAMLLGMPDAPGNQERQVARFTLWDEVNDEAAFQLDADELQEAAYDEDSPIVALYQDGGAYLVMGGENFEEEPAAPVTPEEPLPVVQIGRAYV